MRSRFLNNQWRFCHVRNNPENRFEFECERERLLNLRASLNFKWTSQSWGWKDHASGRCTSLWGKPKRRILKQMFRSLRVFRPPKLTYLEWNLLGFMKVLGWLRFGTFLFERKRFVEWRLASAEWSGLHPSRGISRRGDTQTYRVWLFFVETLFLLYVYHQA